MVDCDFLTGSDVDMAIFMLGTYALLAVIAIFLFANGLSPLMCLSLFIYPTFLFAVYIVLVWQRSKSPAYANHVACEEILAMTVSNDCFPPFDDAMFDKLDKEFGGHDVCDMRGYMHQS